MVSVKAYNVQGDGVTDDTSAIQAALDSLQDIYFPQGDYCIDARVGILPHSAQTLKLHPNARLKVIPNALTAYKVISLANVDHVQIIGGQIIGDRDIHLGSTGEFGYGIALNNATDIVLEDVYAANCWGDGIFIDGNSQRVHINRVICDNNRRQGMSIISADGVHVVESLFKNTNGTDPQAGVDLEPDGGKTVQNVIFDRCQFINNNTYNLKGQGLLGTLKHIQVINCEASGIRQGFIFSNCSDIQIRGGRGHNGTYNGVHLLNVNGAIIDGMSNHDNHGSGQGCGVLVDTTSSNIILANNLLTNNTYGVYIGALVDGVTLIGNRATVSVIENIHIEVGAKNVVQV